MTLVPPDLRAVIEEKGFRVTAADDLPGFEPTWITLDEGEIRFEAKSVDNTWTLQRYSRGLRTHRDEFDSYDALLEHLKALFRVP